MRKSLDQIIPILLTVVTCALLVTFLFFFIKILNFFPTKEKIALALYPIDVLVGFIIYIKTSVDFALFIGNLMKKFPGMLNRIAIETGTALGNGIGTLLILAVWTFFKEVPILMIIMITLASLVLFRMAEDGIHELKITNFKAQPLLSQLLSILKGFNSFFDPIIKLILPRPNTNINSSRSFTSLIVFSFSIPFILGLDDFAGYIPLFSIVNVFGFATGIFLGHMTLNLFLFASPKTTVKIVSIPLIIVLGAFVFLGLSFFGLYEAVKILLHTFNFL